MASESGVSTGGEEEGIPSDGRMTESDAPVMGKDDHVTTKDSQVTMGDSSDHMESPGADRHNSARGGHAMGSGHHIPPYKTDSRVTLSEDHVSSRLKDQSQLTENGSHVIDDSDEDTAGEFGDCLPQDSTSTATTDALNEPMEPIDFIESHPHSHAPSFHGAIGRAVLRASPAIQYANWGELAELTENSRRGKVHCKGDVCKTIVMG